jgi:hypothetical protein
VKKIECQEKATCLRTLQYRITEAIATVTEVMFVIPWHEIVFTCVEQIMEHS